MIPANLPDRFSLKARLLFPVNTPPITDGTVNIEGGKIVSAGESSAAPFQPLFDCGNTAITPGFVNAHTHLEFSDLDAPLGEPRIPFADWIRLVVRHRRQQTQAATSPSSSQAPSTDSHAAIRRGIRESLAHGVTMIGEIASSPRSIAADMESIGRDDWPAALVILFQELLGLAPDRAEALTKLAEHHLESRERVGLSPHSPYTASPQTVLDACRLSSEYQIPVAMHLAETVEELELLASHSGPFVELLRELEAWYPSAIPRGIEPRDYLEMLGQASRALVIHGNYLRQDDFQWLAAHRDHMSLIHCPRTHAFFCHSPFPLRDLLAQGVHVAIGTDSRASNPDLSILNELRFVAQHHPEVNLADVLRLGTLSAAEALGVAKDAGSIEPGKRADLALVEFAAVDVDQPHAALLRSSRPIVATIAAGRLAAGKLFGNL